jgi:DNA repair exonuclease SbcCD ATPase subunit
MSSSTAIKSLLEEINVKERQARRRAVIYSMIPIAVAVVLVAWTAREVAHARAEVEKAEKEVGRLQQQADSANQQLRDAATKLVGIATATREIETLIESKQSYLRTIDEARFLIDIRMKFDALNSDLLKLSESFPAMETIADNRKWVTVVKSSRDLNDLKTAAPAWIADYGRSNVAIYRTPNGFYALAVPGDGTFTQAYRLTVSLMRSGRARDAYFAEASGWGSSLI